MDDHQPDSPSGAAATRQPTGRVEPSAEPVCYRHPETPTRLRCSRCDRPICGACATPASVGQHCPECVGAARRAAPKVRSRLRAQAPAVYFILVVNVVFFVAQTLSPALTARLGLVPREIAEGEWWRLLAPMVLHGGLFHLFVNGYVLWAYGPVLEDALGTLKFAAVYVASGFLGAAASYTFSPCGVLGVGASGAIFGVVGALLVFLYRRRSSAFVASYFKGILAFIAINLVFGLLIPFVDNFAHLGGLAGGVLAGAGLDRPGASGASKTLQVATLLGVAGLAAGLVAYRTLTFMCV